jgi:hypothetical protein
MISVLAHLCVVQQRITQCSMYNAHAATIQQVHALATSSAVTPLAACAAAASAAFVHFSLFRAAPPAAANACSLLQLLAHLFAVHQGVSQCRMDNANAASIQQVHTLALPWGPRQLAQLLHCCCISAGFTLLVAVEINEEA